MMDRQTFLMGVLVCAGLALVLSGSPILFAGGFICLALGALIGRHYYKEEPK